MCLLFISWRIGEKEFFGLSQPYCHRILSAAPFAGPLCCRYKGDAKKFMSHQLMWKKNLGNAGPYATFRYSSAISQLQIDCKPRPPAGLIPTAAFTTLSKGVRRLLSDCNGPPSPPPQLVRWAGNRHLLLWSKYAYVFAAPVRLFSHRYVFRNGT